MSQQIPKRILFPPPFENISQYENESFKVQNPRPLISTDKKSNKQSYSVNITQPSINVRKTDGKGGGMAMMPDSNEQIMSLTRMMDKYQDDLKEIYESIHHQYSQMYYASDTNVSNCIKMFDYMNNFKHLIKKWKELSNQETNDFGYMKLDDQLRLLLENLDMLTQLDFSPMLPILNCMKDKIRQTRKIKLLEFCDALNDLYMNVRTVCDANLRVEIDEHLKKENPTAIDTKRYLQRLYDVTINDERHRNVWNQSAARLLYKKELKDYKE